MPPRKSDVRPSTPVAAEEASPSSAKAAQTLDKTDKKDKDKDKDKDKGKAEDAVTIEDLTLPKSIITRLAKGILPPNTQIQGNAILALSKSATVFISYLASHANENTVAAGKKTILPADVFKALDDTEFSFLKGPLEAEFAKFNAIQTEKRTTYRQKVRASKHGPGGGGDDTDMADTTMASEASASSAGPRAKKARVAHEDNEDEDVDDDEEIDAIVNDDDDVVDDDDDDEDEEEEAQEDDEDAADEDEDEAGDGAEGSSDETQDALEEKRSRDEPDEALEGDESD
ncbi:histone-fold-containing protein [Trichoderma longibrachiatum]|uniref:DNA polymerase epsilon subunit D n=1 Tax=Trichoderma longibrachiatum ATCC 18648 TaxID=983965 RepID=A0A2T4C988_TRILO|nr:histone-fold-containing protein [Trichoderma longibrachiatum ATCC 18648]